jgi:hypothetical protein
MEAQAAMKVSESLITCPQCGLQRMETMPSDACQFFYECTGCRAVLRPKPGDCCVFCSYGSVKCPPKQEDGARSTSVHASCSSATGAGTIPAP